MTEFRAFTVADAVDAASAALGAASAALSGASGGPVTIDAVRRIGDEARRNLILRARAARDGAAPRSIIIKATRAASYDPDAVNAYETSGFVKEWAATRYLARDASGPDFAPALLAADLRQGVLVYDDLGEHRPSLVEPLLHGTAQDAEHALIAYAEALAALHGATIGCRGDHAAILRGGYPATAIPPPAHRWVETVASVPHAVLGGDFPDDEMAFIADRLRRPGRWQALVHGDPCPDNVLLAADGRAILIDFEFARPGHALLDAAYWRMGFPTCWCAGTVPAEIGRRIDQAYRSAIEAAVPDAADDVAFRRESAIIDAAWLLGNLGWLLLDALAEDATWGRATNRSRILSYLDIAIGSAEQAGNLPRLRALASAWRDDLRGRWPATTKLADFPAFAAGPAAA